MQSLVERFLSVELLFAGKANDDAVVAELIKSNKDDPEVRAPRACVGGWVPGEVGRGGVRRGGAVIVLSHDCRASSSTCLVSILFNIRDGS